MLAQATKASINSAAARNRITYTAVEYIDALDA